MDVVKGAVGCAVVALLVGHQLSILEAGGRIALLDTARAALGFRAPAPIQHAILQGASPTLAASAPAAPFGDESIAPDRFGQFQTSVEIDGERLPVLVDTGATFVALSAEDADRIGIRPLPSDFRYGVDTANGRVAVAKVQLAAVRLGGIELRDVTALVSGRGQLGRTLLGMSFLSRLSGVRIDHGRLILSRRGTRGPARPGVALCLQIFRPGGKTCRRPCRSPERRDMARDGRRESIVRRSICKFDAKSVPVFDDQPETAADVASRHVFD